MKMSYREEKPRWSVFDGVKSISTSPEALMANIIFAITSLEHARASSFLQSPIQISKDKNISKNQILSMMPDWLMKHTRQGGIHSCREAGRCCPLLEQCPLQVPTRQDFSRC